MGRCAHAFGARLHDLGIGKGDKVIFWSENRPEWIIAFWGCLLVGAIVVPIDYRSSPDFMARVSRIVRAKLALVGHDVPPIRVAIDAPVWKLHDLEWGEGRPPAVALTRSDIAEIIFTSGATAEPKGVLITHANVLANIVPVEREILKYPQVRPRHFFRSGSSTCCRSVTCSVRPWRRSSRRCSPGEVIFMRGYNPAEIVVADQAASRVGPHFGAEDPRGVARTHRAIRSGRAQRLAG